MSSVSVMSKADQPVSEQPQPQQVEILLKKYERNQLNLKQYCQLSELALKLPPQTLVQAYQKLQPSQRSDRDNCSKLFGLLCHPNLSYPLPKADPKRTQEMLEAGKRITALITYAWDHYVSLLKASKERDAEERTSKPNQQIETYSVSNIAAARKRIEDMLRELKDDRYYWQNYTKEGLTMRQQVTQQIEEQQVFIKVLQNILLQQIEKNRQKVSGMQQQAPQELAREEQPAGVADLHTENGLNQCLKDVQSYFKRKLEGRAKKAELPDPIAKCQAQRKFNAAAMRYYIQTHPTTVAMANV